MSNRIQIRRDTAANWTSVNPILASGEIGLETDTNKFKIGNGATVWVSLAYFGGSSAVSSVAGRTGAVTLAVADVTGAAPLASPALTGTPTAPTASALDNTTKVATTAYTDTAVSVEATARSNADALKAPLASPALTGTPTAPTAAALDNTTKLSTTAYADAAVLVEKTRALAAEGTTSSNVTTNTANIASLTLNPTAVKVNTYTAAAQDLVLCDANSRTVADGVLNTTTTVTSATAAFVAGDVGRAVSGTGIPGGATIASVTNATTIILSAAATATASSVSLTFGGAFTVTLPTAPADKTLVEVKKVESSTNAVTVALGGSDVFNVAGGATSATLAVMGHALQMRYQSAGAIWIVIASDVPLAQSDLRYVANNPANIVLLPPRKACVVGGYQYNNTLSNGTDTATNTQVAYTLPAGLKYADVILRFSNSSTGTTGETSTGLGLITITASVATVSAGPYFPMTWAGQKSITIPADAMVDTDPLPFVYGLVSGVQGKLYVRTFVSVASAGLKWPVNVPVGSGAGGQSYTSQGSAAETDLTLSGTAPVGTYAGAVAVHAVLTSYLPATTPSVALIGDSIMAGQGDTTMVGFAQRALVGVANFAKVAVSGSRGAHYLDPNLARRREAIMAGTNIALVEFFTNDIYTDAATLATVQANAILLWSQEALKGRKVYQTTLLPQSSTTDAYATLANQTTRTGNATRVSFNNWVRDGAPVNSSTLAAVAVGTVGALRAGTTGHPLTGYFETADIAESSRDSGKWIVTGAANYATTDGTHPTAAVHLLIAAAITPATFTAAMALH